MSEERMEQLFEFIKNDRGDSYSDRIMKLNKEYSAFG